MKERLIKILYWTVLVLLAAGIVWQISSEEFDQVLPMEGDGTWLLHREEMIPREDVKILMASEGKLYLYYRNSELLNVYSADGQFLYGIQFPDYQNGRAMFRHMDGLLYADIPMSGVYIFDGCELVRYDDSMAFYREIRDIFTEEYPNTDGEYTYVYVAENNRVLRTGKGETEILLQFPQKSPHYNAFLLLFALFVVAGCEYEKIKRPFTKSR